jgi:hypothetical protein
MEALHSTTFHAAVSAWPGRGDAAFAPLWGRLTWLARVQVAAAAMAAASAHLLLLRRLAPGARRLAAALPLIPLHAVLPLLFDPSSEVLSRAVATACLTWLSSCKASTTQN